MKCDEVCFIFPPEDEVGQHKVYSSRKCKSSLQRSNQHLALFVFEWKSNTTCKMKAGNDKRESVC
jgi:hypothetical protein